MSLDLAIVDATVVLPASPTHPLPLREEQTNVGIKDGKIAAIGAFAAHKAQKVIDAKGLHLLPGLIDSQVHFREPGLEYKEDFASGTAGAVMGGITSVFEMPNTKPPTTNAINFNDKLTRAKGRGWCNYAFYMGAAAENAQKLTELEKLPGCCGTKIFMGSSTGNLLVSEDHVIEQVLRATHRNVAVHSEDEPRLKERFAIAETHAGDVQFHPVWRDEETALRSTQRLIQLAQKCERKVHVLHISTRQELEFLKDKKKWCSLEVTPQHLSLAAPECYEQLGTLAQMNPPLRDRSHQDALWKALNEGLVDVIGSDHAPHTLEEKRRPYPQSPSGMPGVQTTVPVMLNHVHHQRLSLLRLVELLSVTPARLFHLENKGRIAEGFDADLTLVDLQARREITNSWVQSRSGWSPFNGLRVTGWPISTIVGGHIVMRDDQILGSPVGQPLKFADLRID